MDDNKSIGRRLKVDCKIIIKLVDAIQHNANITDACRYAGISRDTFYSHLNSQELFTEKMTAAKDNQNKAAFIFLTVELFN